MLYIHGDLLVVLDGGQRCRHIAGGRLAIGRMRVDGHILIRKTPVEGGNKLIDEIGVQPAAGRFQIEARNGQAPPARRRTQGIWRR